MTALTDAELARVASLLDQAELRARAQLTASAAAPPSPEPSDQADQADRDTDLRMGEAVETHARRELADIGAARQRLANGSYGFCIECGEEIPPPRLLAYPTARRCMDCQRAREAAPALAGGRQR